MSIGSRLASLPYAAQDAIAMCVCILALGMVPLYVVVRGYSIPIYTGRRLLAEALVGIIGLAIGVLGVMWFVAWRLTSHLAMTPSIVCVAGPATACLCIRWGRRKPRSEA